MPTSCIECYSGISSSPISRSPLGPMAPPSPPRRTAPSTPNQGSARGFSIGDSKSRWLRRKRDTVQRENFADLVATDSHFSVREREGGRAREREGEREKQTSRQDMSGLLKLRDRSANQTGFARGFAQNIVGCFARRALKTRNARCQGPSIPRTKNAATS